VLAAFIHGAAADRIAERTGSSGLLASELAAELPVTVAALRAEARAESRDDKPDRFAVSFPEP
jgi:hypothetical protein